MNHDRGLRCMREGGKWQFKTRCVYSKKEIGKGYCVQQHSWGHGGHTGGHSPRRWHLLWSLQHTRATCLGSETVARVPASTALLEKAVWGSHLPTAPPSDALQLRWWVDSMQAPHRAPCPACPTPWVASPWACSPPGHPGS